LALGLTPGIPGFEWAAHWLVSDRPALAHLERLTLLWGGQDSLPAGPPAQALQPLDADSDGPVWPGAWLTTDLQATIGASALGRGVSRLSAPRKTPLSLLPPLQTSPPGAWLGALALGPFLFCSPLRLWLGALLRLRGPPRQTALT
jgi:hypothetical protein